MIKLVALVRVRCGGVLARVCLPLLCESLLCFLVLCFAGLSCALLSSVCLAGRGCLLGRSLLRWVQYSILCVPALSVAGQLSLCCVQFAFLSHSWCRFPRISFSVATAALVSLAASGAFAVLHSRSRVI